MDVPEDSAELAAYRLRAAEACRIADRMQAMMLPAFRKSWRWRFVFLRAMIDREILAERETDNGRRCMHKSATAKAYYDELATISRGPDWVWHP